MGVPPNHPFLGAPILGNLHILFVVVLLRVTCPSLLGTTTHLFANSTTFRHWQPEAVHQLLLDSAKIDLHWTYISPSYPENDLHTQRYGTNTITIISPTYSKIWKRYYHHHITYILKDMEKILSPSYHLHTQRYGKDTVTIISPTYSKIWKRYYHHHITYILKDMEKYYHHHITYILKDMEKILSPSYHLHTQRYGKNTITIISPTYSKIWKRYYHHHITYILKDMEKILSPSYHLHTQRYGKPSLSRKKDLLHENHALAP